MALRDEVKVALRVTSPLYDSEVDLLIAAAKADIGRVGVPENMLADDNIDPIAKMAVILYCKAHFGYDNSQSEQFLESYRHTIIDMLNSPTTYGAAQ